VQFIVREDTAGGTTSEQAFRHRVADELLHGIAHRACAEFRVETLSDEKRQRGLVEFDPVTACGEEFDFAGQELLCNPQLVFLAQAMEHEFLIHTREDLRAQGLLRTGEDVAFQRGFVRVLEAHQFRRADV